MPLEKTLIRGKILNPLSRSKWEYFPNGAFIVDNKGRIEKIGEYREVSKTDGISCKLDYSGSLVLPGFIDTHTHLPQLPIRGKTAGELLTWLNKYAFPSEEAFEEPSYAKHISDLFFRSLKANGTTTALVLSSIHETSTHIAFESAEQSGMRVIMGKVMMDQNAPERLKEKTSEAVSSSERLAKTWHGRNQDLLRYAFTPRFALSCSMELLEAAGNLCRQFPQSYLHSHLSENPDEVKQVRSLYNNQYSYTGIYEKAGCLGPGTIMAHAIHLSPEEMVLLAESETKIAHCPTSNFFLKSGFFNLSAFLKYGIPVSLGTDIGAGPDLSMFRVMRSMDEVQLHYQSAVKPAEALYYATLAGAEALSLENETGNLLPGKSADFILLSSSSFSPSSILPTDDMPIEEILSQLVYMGESCFQVVGVFVRGRSVFRTDQIS